jgi:Family of unknown function (DUF6460)
VAAQIEAVRFRERAGSADGGAMLKSLFRTVVNVAVGSLIVGTILAHFGLTVGALLGDVHIPTAPIEVLLRDALAWVLPNIALGALVIVPVWLLAYLLRPSRESRSSRE